MKANETNLVVVVDSRSFCIYYYHITTNKQLSESFNILKTHTHILSNSSINLRWVTFKVQPIIDIKSITLMASTDIMPCSFYPV